MVSPRRRSPPVGGRVNVCQACGDDLHDGGRLVARFHRRCVERLLKKQAEQMFLNPSDGPNG